MTVNQQIIAVLLACTPLLAHSADEPSAAQPEKMSEPPKHEMAPPPPPGPYMSTALSDNKQFVGGHDMNEPASGDSPFFRPDMPWPDHRMPHPWMPEDGYQFAPPGAPMGMQRPATSSRPAMPMHRRPSMPARSRAGAQPNSGMSMRQQRRPMPAQMDRRQRMPQAMPMPRHQQMQPPPQRPQANRPAMRNNQPAHQPPMPAARGKRGNQAQRPHMMDRRSAQPNASRRNMPPPPQGPWLPLDRYPRW